MLQAPQKVEIDANHPVIMDLKKATEHAQDEAARARKGLYSSFTHILPVVLYSLYNHPLYSILFYSIYSTLPILISYVF